MVAPQTEPNPRFPWRMLFSVRFALLLAVFTIPSLAGGWYLIQTFHVPHKHEPAADARTSTARSLKGKTLPKGAEKKHPARTDKELAAVAAGEPEKLGPPTRVAVVPNAEPHGVLPVPATSLPPTPIPVPPPSDTVLPPPERGIHTAALPDQPALPPPLPHQPAATEPVGQVGFATFESEPNKVSSAVPSVPAPSVPAPSVQVPKATEVAEAPKGLAPDADLNKIPAAPSVQPPAIADPMNTPLPPIVNFPSSNTNVDAPNPVDAPKVVPGLPPLPPLPEPIAAAPAAELLPAPPTVLPPVEQHASRIGSAVVPFPATTPQPTPTDLEKFGKYVDGFFDANNALDLIQRRTRVMKLKEPPKRIHVSDEGIVTVTVLGPKTVAVQGMTVGSATINLWFPGPVEGARDVELSYLVHVHADPDAKERSERTFKTLELEIHRLFPESDAQLKLVGDAVVVAGQARDGREATQILNIVAANTPWATPVPRGAPSSGADQHAGSPQVINMLRAGGTQGAGGQGAGGHGNAGQGHVILKVAVAEMQRSLACNLGLPCNGSNQPQATVCASTAELQGKAGMGQFLTIRGEPATYLGGGQFALPVTSGSNVNRQPGATFHLHGVEMSFTPCVIDGNVIRLKMSTTSNFSTVLEFREGQTVGVTGLMHNNIVVDREPQPAGRPSLLSRLTGAPRTPVPVVIDQEIVVFITPEVATQR